MNGFRSVWEPQQEAMRFAIPLLMRKKAYDEELALKKLELDRAAMQLEQERQEKIEDLKREADNKRIQFAESMYKEGVKSGNEGIASSFGRELQSEGYPVATRPMAPGMPQEQFIVDEPKPEKPAETWADYTDQRFPNVKFQKSDTTGKIRVVTSADTGPNTSQLTSLRFKDKDGVLRQKYVSKDQYEDELNKIIAAGGTLATNEAEGMAERRDLLSKKDLAKTEEIILSNPDEDAVAGHINTFNEFSDTPYMYVQKQTKGFFGPNTELQRVDLPSINGVQLTAKDVVSTAQKHGVPVQKVLQDISDYVAQQQGNKPDA